MTPEDLRQRQAQACWERWQRRRAELEPMSDCVLQPPAMWALVFAILLGVVAGALFMGGVWLVVD